MKKKNTPIYPILFGLFPPLSLLSTNIGDARFLELWLPLVVTLAIVLGLGSVLWLVIRNQHKTAALVAAFWVPFYSYGFLIDGLKTALREGQTPVFVLLLSALIGVFGVALAVIVWRSKRDWAPLSGALNNVGVFLLVVPLISYGLAKVQQEAPEEQSLPEQAQSLSAEARAKLPDIYYIIPDSYPRADILLETFDYDNTPFLEGLKERGFYTVEDSYSNYPKTQMSLASSMNLDYLDPKHLEAEWNEALPNFVAQIWDNKVMDFLESYGYEFPTFSSGVAATEIDNGRFVKPDTFVLSELQRVYIAMTPLRSPVERMTRSGEANRVLFVVDELGKIRRGEKPMFVFAHMMSPHMPHTFDAEGNPVTETPDYYKGFRDETICLNERFLVMIDRIQARQPNSIIIIQGDHGCRSDWQSTDDGTLIPWEGSREDYIRDYTAVLNTIYIPDGDYSEFYSGITPVNTFRILFNKYFGTDYELLPDKTFLSFQGGKRIEEVR